MRSRKENPDAMVLSYDPAVLARSVRDPGPLLDDLDLPEEVPEDEVRPDWAGRATQMRHLLDLIPPCEADCFELYYIRGCRQLDIAELQGICQAGVSYRLETARRRLQFLAQYPGVGWTHDSITAALSPYPKWFAWPSEVTIQIVAHMLLATCQSRVARDLGRKQGQVRGRFLSATRALQEMAVKYPDLEPYARAARMVVATPNILNEPLGQGPRAQKLEVAQKHSKVTHMELQTIENLKTLNQILGEK